ncbi:Glycosyltransferase 2-like [Trypanosoma melophagium]|uniref:Glycosyltransferase 2-like n=1 Tax=Trypanosoma melophagium TaxID=715481 RepID=UPI00351A1361|nr:Glycosyltransferase 2-like [Trypanosoma melophagium]
MKRITITSVLRMQFMHPPRNKSWAIVAVILFATLLLLLWVTFIPFTVEEIEVRNKHPIETPPAVRPDRYLRCVGDRLLVDAASRRLGNNSGPGVLPVMVVPLMLDLPDFRELMCNISVPVRRLVLVQNGAEPQLAAFLQALLDAYGWSGRLVVWRHAENIGYSGAVNAGLRLALSLPREEAPFVFITNSDVTFSPELLPRLLQEVHERTKNDAARLDALAAEVQREPSGHAPHGRRAAVLRSPHGNSSLSTSALLPDRIRYAPPDQRSKSFSDHYGIFCMGSKESCFTSVILTRLAISTVGFFDENFFPYGVEDVDYSNRLRLLGFKKYVVNYGTFVRLGKVHYRVSRDIPMCETCKDRLWLHRVLELRTAKSYSISKWRMMRGTNPQYRLPFSGKVPPDVWVRDDARIKVAQEYGRSPTKVFPNVRYNASLLIDALK